MAFKPFIGKNQALERKPLIMILGESHYGTGQDRSEFTTEFLECYISGNVNCQRKYYDNILRIIYGEKWNKALFQNHLFYNYVQEFVGDEYGIRPTKEMWKNAEDPFMQILDEYKPDIVLCFGKQLYSHLPKTGSMYRKEENGKYSSAWKYSVGDKEVIVYRFPHVSYSFNFTWDDIKKRMNNVKNDFPNIKNSYQIDNT